MNKKKIGVLLTIVLWLVTLAISFFVGVKYHEASTAEIKNTKDYSQIVEEESDVADHIAEVPVSYVESVATEQENGITKQEAENLCIEALGDKAEENGFPISYRCIGAVSANNNLYYVMHIAWLVDNNHWSYIGNCYVSSDGQEIYDGIVSESKYEITKLRWKQ